MRLAGVRRHLEDARAALLESAASAKAGDYDPAYRAALRSRNFLFHATRGLASARGEPPPEMPVVGVSGGGLADHERALGALESALALPDDLTMPAQVAAAREPYARYLGWLRDEVAKRLHAGR